MSELAEQAALRLQAFVEQGEEIPFELESHNGRRGAAPLYCYRPLTAAYLAERLPHLRALPSFAPALALIEGFPGLDRYLVGRGVEPRRPGRLGRAGTALLAFLQDVFGEQSDFRLQAVRLERAVERLEGSALAQPAEVTVLATLHGLAIAGEQLRLTSGLVISQPQALSGAADQALSPVGTLTGAGDPLRAAGTEEHLLVAYADADADAAQAVARGAAVLRDLLRALRLFGDGRIALGPVAWTRVGDGPWTALALGGGGGHPHGMLLVAAGQEDELRAFCNLVSRRTPDGGPLAWALRRFEMGCERPDEYEALSDHLMALRTVLTRPSEAAEGGLDGLLAARLSALCATPPDRPAVAERALAAIALERDAILGTAVEHAGGLLAARELSNHLRALLRDVICGHLPTDLVSLAEELLDADTPPRGEEALCEDALGDEALRDEALREEALGDGGQAGQILDLAV